MSYTVLARKYRSVNFEDIVGQDAIATTLKNAVKSGRIHHGYLFTGTRGVGKTSSARILAKALNCMASDGPTPDPCAKCESCLRIAEGEDLDVVEIDAASNTGVDNIRELRSNASFRPARSRFKVYIIDEVHMLSAGAFNALLKTLEEPPSHVKFILATTETHKVPATIQSRCQRFDFRSIDVDTIVARLNAILKAEKIKADEFVVRRVARLANGSMRDALSLLDQLLSYGTSDLTPELIEEILPTAHDELIFELIEAIAGSDAASALRKVDRCLSAGYTPERFCDAVIEHCRTLMLLAVCGPQTDLLDLTAPLRGKLNEQSKRFDAATYVYIIALLEELRRMVKASGAGRALVDAAVVRLSSARQFSNVERLLAELRGDTPAAPTPPSDPKKKDNVRAVSGRAPEAASDPTAQRRAGFDRNEPAAAIGDGPAQVSADSDRASDAARTDRGINIPSVTSERRRAALHGSGPVTSEPADGERAATLVPQRPPRPPPAVTTTVGRATTADRQRVLMDPLVRSALELFNGSLVEVRPPVAETTATPSLDETAAVDET